MVILQVNMFTSWSVAMPTFSSQISKLFPPFGRVQLEPVVAWAVGRGHIQSKKKFVGRNVAVLSISQLCWDG